MLRKCGHVGQLLLLGDQSVQLTVQMIDSCLNLTGSLLPGSSLSCYILGTEAVDVAFVLAMDQTEQILVMKRATLASDVADAAIVVQVDVHVPAISVQKLVEFGGAAIRFTF